MTKVIPIITWTGDNAVALSRTLDTVSDWETVYLYTTETYENTQRVLGNSFKGSGNVVVFTTNNPDTTVSDMKNQGILDVSADWPDAYVIFLEAGDQIGLTELCTDDITTDDPVYYGAVAGEYHGKVFEPLYEILEYSLPEMVCDTPFRLSPISLAMNTIAKIIEVTMQIVFKVSVQMTDLTPPRKVYSRTIATEMMAFRINGRPKGSNTISWRVTQTR